MKILCLAKFVPDVENFKYDYEKNVLVRDNVHLVLNPEDATALAHALAIKAELPGSSVETVSMAPKGVVPHLEDLVRRGVDRAILISDPLYVGSDTYVTSRILARCIERRSFDYIVTGTHTLDGGTAHVPAQLAEALDLAHLSNIVEIDHGSLREGRAVVEVDGEEALLTFEVDAPAVLGLSYSTGRTLPYIPYETIDLDVRDRIEIVTNDALGFDRGEVGLAGSPTQVASVEVRTPDRKETVVVGTDDEGIETVFRFLVQKGFLRR